MPGGGFSVSASDTYTAAGIYTATIVIVSSDGSTATVYDPMSVYQPLLANQPPTASVLAPDVTTENADYLAPYTFDIVYQSSSSISASSLPNSTIEIVPPDQPPLVARQIAVQSLGAVDAFGDAPTIVATYQVLPPGGNWAAAPSGTYNIVLGGAPITDLTGKAVAVGVLGSFNVSVPPLIALSSPAGTDVQNNADVSASAALSLTGFALANSELTIFNGNTALGSVAAGADGSWTFNYSASADGLYDFTVTASSPQTGISTRSVDELVEVDTVPPTSMVTALPVQSPAGFTLTWTGSDGPGDPGIASYDIYVSDNGGPFVPLLTDSFQTSTIFDGQLGHTYGFYSVATDLVGMVQPTPTVAQATTTVDTALPAPTAASDTFVLGSRGPFAGSGATSVLANDTSADGQPQNLVATLVSSTTSGSLTLYSDGSFVYTPDASFQGIDRFTYQVSEGGTAGNTVTVTLLSYNASLVDKLYQQVLHRPAEDSGLISIPFN